MKCSLHTTESLLPAFHTCIEKKDYSEALYYCGEIELAIEDTNLVDVHADLAQFFFCYMAAYLITGDLDGARFLWRRLPPSSKQNQPDIAELWTIGKCLWLQDYSMLRSCFEKSWSENIRAIIDDVKVSVYHRNLKQISEAYSVISLLSLCEVLMLSADEAKEVCSKLNWEIDSNGEFVRTKEIVDTTIKLNTRTFDKDMETLQNLSTYAANFEKKSLKVDLSTPTPQSSQSQWGKKNPGY